MNAPSATSWPKAINLRERMERSLDNAKIAADAADITVNLLEALLAVKEEPTFMQKEEGG